MRYLISSLILLAVLGTLATVKASQISMLIGVGKAMEKAGPPPETVTATRVEEQTWEANVTAVGSVVAAKGVTVSNDVPGVVTRISFESGAKVRQGQVLVELDSNVERAQLMSVRARKGLAETSLKRTQALVESGALAPAQLDSDQASYSGITADTSALEAQIAKKVIKAPFSGRLGIRAVNVGQYLAPGTTIAVLSATKQVYVDFSLPQQELSRVSVKMPVRLFDAGQPNLLAVGEVSAIEPEVDSVTRSVKLRASIPNPDEKLHPGMFVQVTVVLPVTDRVLAIPATALVRATYGDSVFIADVNPTAAKDAKSKFLARQQFVKVGQLRGDFVAIIDGVKPGENVVSAGAFKLRNGLSLVLSDEVQLAPQLRPEVVNR